MAISSTIGRAVHIKFHPRPHTLSESTDVLKILERYGEVEYFRQLQFEPVPARNSAVAIYKHQDGATKVCRASPLRFRYGENTEKVQEYGLHATESENIILAHGARKNATRPNANEQNVEDSGAAVSPEIVGYMPPQSASKASETANQVDDQEHRGREVHLQISESKLNHELYLKRQFYHEAWRPKIHSIMARDLEKRTPIPHIGTLSLHKGELVPRLRKIRDDNPKPLLPRLGLLWQKGRARAEQANRADE